MAGCLLIVPLLPEYGKPDSDFLTIEVFDVGTAVLLQTCWMAVILFNPLQQLTRRLAFVVLGVLLLIGLSEISKLNLRQYLPPTRVSDVRQGKAIELYPTTSVSLSSRIFPVIKITGIEDAGDNIFYQASSGCWVMFL
jgi:hypothetical protein